MTLYQEQWENHDDCIIPAKTFNYIIELLNDAIEKNDFVLVERAIIFLKDPEEFSDNYLDLNYTK